jgi:hypothetical protein
MSDGRPEQAVMRAVVADRYAPDHKWAAALRVGEFPAPALPDGSSVRVGSCRTRSRALVCAQNAAYGTRAPPIVDGC